MAVDTLYIKNDNGHIIANSSFPTLHFAGTYSGFSLNDTRTYSARMLNGSDWGEFLYRLKDYNYTGTSFGIYTAKFEFLHKGHVQAYITNHYTILSENWVGSTYYITFCLSAERFDGVILFFAELSMFNAVNHLRGIASGMDYYGVKVGSTVVSTILTEPITTSYGIKILSSTNKQLFNSNIKPLQIYTTIDYSFPSVIVDRMDNSGTVAGYQNIVMINYNEYTSDKVLYGKKHAMHSYTSTHGAYQWTGIGADSNTVGSETYYHYSYFLGAVYYLDGSTTFRVQFVPAYRYGQKQYSGGGIFSSMPSIIGSLANVGVESFGDVFGVDLLSDGSPVVGPEVYNMCINGNQQHTALFIDIRKYITQAAYNAMANSMYSFTNNGNISTYTVAPNIDLL